MIPDTSPEYTAIVGGPFYDLDLEGRTTSIKDPASDMKTSRECVHVDLFLQSLTDNFVT